MANPFLNFFQRRDQGGYPAPTNPYYVNAQNTFGINPEAQTASMRGFEAPTQSAPRSGISGTDLQMGAQLASTAASFLPTDPNEFRFDANAFNKGGAKGLAMGSNPALMAATGGLSAPIGAAVGFTAGGISEGFQNRKALRGVNSNITGFTDTGYSAPVYQGGQVNQALGTLGDINDSMKFNLKSFSGGAIAGATGNLLNRRLRRETRNDLQAGIEKAQTGYNQATQDFEQNQIAQTQYRRRRDLTNRMYNLYTV